VGGFVLVVVVLAATLAEGHGLGVLEQVVVEALPAVVAHVALQLAHHVVLQSKQNKDRVSSTRLGLRLKLIA
jgi:hypothetical protein